MLTMNFGIFFILSLCVRMSNGKNDKDGNTCNMNLKINCEDICEIHAVQTRLYQYKIFKLIVTTLQNKCM